MAPTSTAAKADSAEAKKDTGLSLYVVVFETESAGQVVELHTSETAEARVSALAWGSKQHLKEFRDALDDRDATLPEGGGTHEIDRKDIHVFKLSATEITEFGAPVEL